MTTKSGRTSKFIPQIRDEIIKRLQAGATIKATCDSVNIGESTYYEWVDIGTAVNEQRPHRRMPKKADRQDYAEFAEATTRAIANAMVHATIAFRQGMNAGETTSTTTETLEETRLNSKGEPYVYRRVTTKQTVSKTLGDWKAALEYLSRRDPENWARTTPQQVDVNHSGKVILTWEDKAIALIQQGELTEEKALEVFDNDETLVKSLFARAQARVSTG